MFRDKSVQKQLRALLLDYVIAFLQLFVAMYISELLVQTPAFGGALFIAGQFWATFARVYSKPSRGQLPRTIRAKGAFILVVSLLLCAALVFIYPRAMSRPLSWLLFYIIALMLLRQIVTDIVARRRHTHRIILLVLCHLLFLAAGTVVFVIGWHDQNTGIIFSCLALTGALLLARQFAVIPHRPQHKTHTAVAPDDFMQVQSYRIYNRMVINLLVAVNLSITTYVFYLRYLPYTGFLSSFIGLTVWLLYTLAITWLFSSLLLKKADFQYGKTTLFIIGAILWIVPTLLVYAGRLPLTGIYQYLVWAVFGLALACMLSIIVTMGVEMRGVIELGLGPVDRAAYSRNTRVMANWAMLVSLLLTLGMFTLASFIMDGQIAVLDTLPVLPRVLQLLFFLVPLVCVVLSVGYLVLQPLDRRYVDKLRQYRAGLKKGKLNPAMEERLKKVLVASYPKRIGVRIAKAFIRPFIRLKVTGRENVRQKDMPVVFVCNHHELFGPLAAVLRLPYYFRPWVIYDAVDKELIATKLSARIMEFVPWLPNTIARGIGKAIAPLSYWVIMAQEPIAVYRDSRSIIDTMKETVSALECYDNILIFPEDRTKGEDGKFATQGVGEFFTGFSSIGRSYYKKTGRCLSFIPVYIDKQKRTLSLGQAVVYDPDNNKSAEKDRIVTTLHARMSRMAE